MCTIGNKESSLWQHWNLSPNLRHQSSVMPHSIFYAKMIITSTRICEGVLQIELTFSRLRCNKMVLHRWSLFVSGRTLNVQLSFYLAATQTVSIPFSEKMAKDGKMISEYHDEDVLVGINDFTHKYLKSCCCVSLFCFQLLTEVAIIMLLFCKQDSVLDAVLRQAYKMFKVPKLVLLLKCRSVDGFVF